MFLKLRHQGTWHYWGEVLDVVVGLTRKRHRDAEQFHNITMTRPIVEGTKDFMARSFVLKRKDGREVSILTDAEEAYLCNDRGDTLDSFVCR